MGRSSKILAFALGVILAAPIPAFASDGGAHKNRNHVQRIEQPTIPPTAMALAPLTMFASVPAATGRNDSNEVYEPQPFSHYWR